MHSSSSNSEWGPAPARTLQPEPHRSFTDLVAIVGGVVLFFVLSIQWELAERLNNWTRFYEHWQLDEIPLTLLVLSLGLVWFGWRRWRELGREMQVRSQVEATNLQMLAQNRRLARQLIELQESERRHMARELHDEIGQCCVAIQFDATLIAREARGSHEAIQTGAQRIADTTDHLQGVLRGILNRLRPTGLDDLGLVSSVQIFVEGWQQRNRMACSFSASGALDTLNEAGTITLYRGVQEGLTNIARHARASQASVCIEQTRSASGADQVTLTVRDNGQGLAPLAGNPGLGVLGMRERVNALGGHLALTRLPAGGTQLQLQLPMPIAGAAP